MGLFLGTLSSVSDRVKFLLFRLFIKEFMFSFLGPVGFKGLNVFSSQGVLIEEENRLFGLSAEKETIAREKQVPAPVDEAERFLPLAS